MKKFTDWFYDMQGIPATAKIFMLQNLAVMVKAGLPLASAITTLAEQTKNRKLKKILTEAQEKIKSGKTFAEALTPYVKDFGEVFVNMIGAGDGQAQKYPVPDKLAFFRPGPAEEDDQK